MWLKYSEFSSQRPQKKTEIKFNRKFVGVSKFTPYDTKYLAVTQQPVLSMEQISSSEADSSSVSQIPSILWNSKYITTFTRARRINQGSRHHFVKTHFNIILHSASRYSKLFIPYRTFSQSPVWILLLLNTCIALSISFCFSSPK